MSRKPVAEIAGAGLAGLAAAAALAQRGWSVRVHEKGKSLREIGAGLYCWENALNALRELGVYEQVAATGVASKTPRALLDHKGMEINLRRSDDRTPELIVVLRTELHKILAECAIKNGAEIVTDSPVLGADPDGRLELKEGLGPKADLVIGADGVFSRVRGLVKARDRDRRSEGWLRPPSDLAPAGRWSQSATHRNVERRSADRHGPGQQGPTLRIPLLPRE